MLTSLSFDIVFHLPLKEIPTHLIINSWFSIIYFIIIIFNIKSKIIKRILCCFYPSFLLWTDYTYLAASILWWCQFKNSPHSFQIYWSINKPIWRSAYKKSCKIRDDFTQRNHLWSASDGTGSHHPINSHQLLSSP